MHLPPVCHCPSAYWQIAEGDHPWISAYLAHVGGHKDMAQCLPGGAPGSGLGTQGPQPELIIGQSGKSEVLWPSLLCLSLEAVLGLSS